MQTVLRASTFPFWTARRAPSTSGGTPDATIFRLALTIWLLIILPIQMPTAAAEREIWVEALAPGFAKDGRAVLRAFKPIAETARASVAVMAVDGTNVALGAIVDPDGLLITKSSELKAGKLTCKLIGGKTWPATVIASDHANDVALVKIGARGLKPVRWAASETTVGDWVMTPSLESIPAAVGIISVPIRRILPKRALIGVLLDTNSGPARLARVTPGFGAAKAGLMPGDVILTVNGKIVAGREDVMTTLRELEDGQIATLRIRRDVVESDYQVEMTAESTVMAAEFGGRRGPGRGGGGGSGGFDRTDRMNRMGSTLSSRAENFELAVQHDTVLEAWQCGGPLINLDGRAVGLNIARAGRVASYALPATLVERIIHDLKLRAGISAGRP